MISLDATCEGVFYEKPGAISPHRLVPGVLDVIVMGQIADIRLSDEGERRAAYAQMLDGDISALALMINEHDRAISSALVYEIGDPELLSMLLHATKINEVKKKLASVSCLDLPENETLTVGRETFNDLVTSPEALCVSRSHLTVTGFTKSFARPLKRKYWLGSVIQGSVEGHRPGEVVNIWNNVDRTIREGLSNPTTAHTASSGMYNAARVLPNSNGSTSFIKSLE